MEKSIPFNTEMVKAILEGRKTSTRRIIKPQPAHRQFGGFVYDSGDKKLIGQAMFINSFPAIGENAADYAKPPYQQGDILWVRETFNTNPVQEYIDKTAPRYVYKATDIEFDGGWKPSIHMPKSAARIFLKVTNVKVQKIQDISQEEARAEGIQWITKDGTVFKYFTSCDAWEDYHRKNKKKYLGTPWQDMPKTAKEAFKILWDSCYYWPKSWDANPWVWVIEFEKVDIN